MAKSIVEWLSGETRFRIDTSMLENIVEDRGFELSQSHNTVEKIGKKLLYADLLRKVYNSPSTIGSYTSKHNAFEESWGSEGVADKTELRNTFMSIYRMYDVDLYNEIIGEYSNSTITQISLRD